MHGMTESGWIFGEYRFDPTGQTLSRGGELVTLSPKASAVLRCLLERAGRLVSKDELLDRVWPDAAVSDASLKVCIGEIRRALGDAVSTERFVATVHRRGYRFVGALDAGEAPVVAAAATGGSLVGRDAPLATVRAALERASAGERQALLITGEAGIGKSSLLDALLDGAARSGVVVARGRCVEHVGAGEAYLPVLEAVSGLRQALGVEPLRAVLRRHAPSWLAQLPGLVEPAELDTLRRATSAGTRERVLRELTDALEQLAAARTVILALEDLHWSDPSTLDVIARLAQRREPARLLVVGTFRPVDAILADHPVKRLKQRLLAQRRAGEVGLDPLDEAGVAAYLTARLGETPPSQLAAALHSRTDGNPLFMVTATDALLDGGLLVHTADGWQLRDAVDAIAARIPDSVRTLVEQQLDTLADDDARLLEAAALAGDEFAGALAAAALAADPRIIETRCATLQRTGYWIRGAGSDALADGTPSDRYRFVHPLHRAVLAERVPAARRAACERRIGEWLEAEHAAAPARVATALAHHFEAGRDAERAIRYRMLAARTATARHAHREAAAELTRALPLVERLPPAEREATRRTLLEQRGAAASAMGDVEAAIEDFTALAGAARHAGAVDEEVQAMLALGTAWSLRDRARGLTLAADAVTRSVRAAPELQRRARAVHAYWWARQHGWRASEADAAAAAVQTMRAGGHGPWLALHLGMHAFFLNLRGDYGAARAAAEEALTLAREGGTVLLAQWHRCWALRHLGAWPELLAALSEARRMAERDGHRLWALVFEQLVAWTLADAGEAGAARPRAEAARVAARGAGHEFGIALGAVVAGVAALGDGDLVPAAAAFAEARASADRDPAAMEWMLRPPLHLGCAAVALARGDVDAAGVDADVAARLAAQAAEPTYTALAAAMRARVAHARGDRAGVGAALAAARAAASDASAVAVARVDAIAAAIAGQSPPDPHAPLRAALQAAPPDVAAALGLVGVMEAPVAAARKRAPRRR